jgi:hypothetical protein
VTRDRAPNLSDDDIAEIVSVLDGWRGKLSWDLLIEAIKRRKKFFYTRQTLHNHARIRQAFSLRKKHLSEALPGGPRKPKPASPEIQVLLDRIGRLEAENARVRGENQALLGQFACWAYNAQTRGLDAAFLSRPLPEVDRDRTGKSDAKKSRNPQGDPDG